MKKLILLLFLFISTIANAQWFDGGINPTLPYTWTGTQTYSKVFIDSLVLRVYLLDTGTSIVRTILPQTTRIYNFGGSSNYWLNSYTQNLYADTVKTDITFTRDVVIDSTLRTKDFSLQNIYFGKRTINSNTVIGMNALKNYVWTDSTSVFRGFNTVIGYLAGMTSDSMYANTFLGAQVGMFTTYGSYNTGVGVQSLSALTTGQDNVGVGVHALNDLRSGSRNIALGKSSLRADSLGNDNVSIGSSAWLITQSNSNIGVGSFVGYNHLTGNDNIVFGHQSGYGLTNPVNYTGNLLLGWRAGMNIRDGNNYNTVIGYNDTAINGNNNILIGNNLSSYGSDTLKIGNLIKGNMNTQQLVFPATVYAKSNLYINNTYPEFNLARTLGSSTFKFRSGYFGSMHYQIDSIGSNKNDTADIETTYWLVNCDNTNNDTVYLADVGITDGFTVQVKKLDANATYVVVIPKGGKTIEGTTEDKFNTQYQTRKYVYKNNTWWIF